jgi:hypothetical protein
VHFLWKRDSTNGLVFSVGKFGLNNIDICLGNEKDQRHNALITGAVGQGKSNMLSIIIHSLCQNYSPQELELYLLDFKEGVTLQNFANINHQEYLPHAKVLGLESDIEFGLATLEHLNQIYEDRMRLFKKIGVQNIKEFRLSTIGKLPRIVLIIDEFQMMFWDKSKSSKIANTLEKSARLFRAAGIHIILASQSIRSDELSGSAIFAQIPIRIAHKNSVSESEATLTFGNIAPTDLRVGQAIINLDYGVISANRKIQVPLADEKILAPLRKTWWSMAQAQTNPPYVFDRNRTLSLSDALIKRPSLAKTVDLGIAGERIAINQSIAQINLAPESGRNVAILGLSARNAPEDRRSRSQNIALGIFESLTVPLALARPKQSVRFIIYNGINRGSADLKDFQIYVDTLKNIGVSVQVLDADQLDRFLSNWKALFNPTYEKTYLIGVLLDKIVNMNPNFARLIKEGPLNGIHVIGWWQKVDRYESQIDLEGNSYFDVKVILRAEERAVQHILGVFDMNFEIDNNRATAFDSAYFDQPIKIIPYETIGPNFLTTLRSKTKGGKP